MNLSELPQNIQDQLREERTQLYIKWRKNTPHEICFTDKAGTRYFYAKRKLDSTLGGAYGSSTWHVAYGKILWDIRTIGYGIEYHEWKMTNQKFGKSSNGTVIPSRIKTKKEVMAVAKAIGTLEMGE